MSEDYNGWVNRETWLVNLWLTNDQATYEAVRGLNGMKLNDYVDGLIEEGGPDGFLLDLVNTALARVHWDEVAESLRAE